MIGGQLAAHTCFSVMGSLAASAICNLTGSGLAVSVRCSLIGFGLVATPCISLISGWFGIPAICYQIGGRLAVFYLLLPDFR